MSKKNKKSTKRNRHANDLRRATHSPLSKYPPALHCCLHSRGSQRPRSDALWSAVEKEQTLQKQKKSEKKAAKQAAKLGAAPAATKPKRKGFRIKKGVRVKGIKVTDAASKKKIKKILAAEQALREMDVDCAPVGGAAAGAGAAMV